MGNPLKIELRNRMKNEILTAMSPESREEQSKIITQKVFALKEFSEAKNISIYLSTSGEVDTTEILKVMFEKGKNVFVPTYRGNMMEMVLLKNWNDYESLPLTKWQIKQPKANEGRENALSNDQGIDLFLMPGVAFTLKCGRLGHGMGYYDKYLARHRSVYPNKSVAMIALAFKEQIVNENCLPLDNHDVILNQVITA